VSDITTKQRTERALTSYSTVSMSINMNIKRKLCNKKWTNNHQTQLYKVFIQCYLRSIHIIKLYSIVICLFHKGMHNFKIFKIWKDNYMSGNTKKERLIFIYIANLVTYVYVFILQHGRKNQFLLYTIK